MELDLAGMHQLAAGQGIDPETLDAALSEALRLAYLKTPHAAKHARVELDPRAGSFTVWAQDEIPVEPTEDNPHPAPTLGEEYDDTPRDFGRLAAATARQVISQLFRKAEDDKVFGAFSGQKGKLITGIVQQDVFLFADTIRENIRYGRPDATDAEVEQAARQAEIYDDICAMLQWTKQERCSKCAIYDQRNTVFMSYCRYCFQIQYIGVWIAQCLTIQKFGVWLNGFTEVLRIRRIYKCYGDSLLF